MKVKTGELPLKQKSSMFSIFNEDTTRPRQQTAVAVSLTSAQENIEIIYSFLLS
jgi:hypothetical protein